MKRMFDKEEIVDLIQEESPKIEVDSELSETSENPVQNKVIYEALADKQDSLPDTLEQEGKFLGVDESGNLAWAEAGGKSLYQHNIYLTATVGNKYPNLLFTIINESNQAMTLNDIATFLNTNGFSGSYRYPVSGRCWHHNDSTQYLPMGLRAGTNTSIFLETIAVNSVTSDGFSIESATIQDKVIQIL